MIISALDRVCIKVFFTDPEVRFAARIDVLADDWTRVLDSLTRHHHTFDLAGRQVDVEQRAFRQTFVENFARGDNSKRRRMSEVVILARHQTQSNTGNAENRRFHRACDGA